MISRPGASDIRQLPFGIVDLFQIGIVGNAFDPFLQRDILVVTGQSRKHFAIFH